IPMPRHYQYNNSVLPRISAGLFCEETRMSSEKITDGMVVSLAYVLTVDGVEVSRTDADDPLEYLHGAENIIPGLEAALTGKQVGDKINVTLAPEDAYGDYDQDEVE